MRDRKDFGGRPGRPEVVRRRRADEPTKRRGPVRGSDIKRRADEFAAQGMPYPMAMAVAQGKLPLNDALVKLNQRVEVDRLMKEHDLTRALATQVVLGHADLAAFLAKRRFEDHRTKNLERSCLDAAVASGHPLTIAVFGQRKIEAKVLAVTPYHVTVQEPGKEPEELHKLELKYAYAPDDWKKLKKIVRKDKELSEAPLRPAERPQDRYTCSDRRLFRYLDEDVAVDVTLLEGEILHGHVTWFSRFEFGLGLKGEGEVTLFRHALHRIQEGK